MFLSSTRGNKSTGKVGGKRGTLQLHPGLQVAAVIPNQSGFKGKIGLGLSFWKDPLITPSAQVSLAEEGQSLDNVRGDRGQRTSSQILPLPLIFAAT